MSLLPDMLTMPERTISGNGSVSRLLRECSAFGGRGMIVHGKSLRKNDVLRDLVRSAPPGVSLVTWEHAGGEPELCHVSELLKAARKHRAKWIAAVGGGSVLDLAKACAGLFHAEREIVFYHDGAPIERKGIAFAAVPTTAGSGSEATTNTVLINTTTGRKKSIRDSRLVARLVILDADLLASCPKQVVAFSGMDAFTHAIEAFVSRGSSWFSDQLALKAIELISGNLEAVYEGGTPGERMSLLTASYLGGLSFTTARLGVVHGLAHPIGARYHLPHGLACAICLPHAIELNREAMGGKYRQMSDAVGQDLSARVSSLINRLDINSPLKLRPIKDKKGIITETLASGSTAANPRRISAADVEFLLARLF